VKSSQVEYDQVDRGRLGVILASSRVTSDLIFFKLWCVTKFFTLHYVSVPQ